MACGHEPADSPSATSSREQASARHDALTLFRIYGEDELGPDGYPFAWKQIPFEHPVVAEHLKGFGLKDQLRLEAGHRCERCHHPYFVKREGNVTSTAGHQRARPSTGEMVQVSRCDDECRHGGPVIAYTSRTGWIDYDGPDETIAEEVYAVWRVLTVHHLNGVKADCRWWNLAALCQRCHLTIQGRVVMERAFILEHSEWMKPHAAGFYADKYLGEQLTREQTLARLDELLALERLA